MAPAVSWGDLPQSFSKKKRRERLASAFREFDWDGNDTLSKIEVFGILTRGGSGKPLTGADAEALIKMSQTDRNGQLSISTLAEAWHRFGGHSDAEARHEAAFSADGQFRLGVAMLTREQQAAALAARSEKRLSVSQPLPGLMKLGEPSLAKVPAATTQPPLLETASNGQTTVMEALIKSGSDVNAKGVGGESALIIAAKHGYWDIVMLLLNSGAEVDAKAEDETTALMHAAMRGNADCLEALLFAGADANAKQRHGMSPIHLAVVNGHAACVRALVDAGMNRVNYNATWHGAKPLEMARNAGFDLMAPDVIEALESGFVVGGKAWKEQAALVWS